MTKRYVVGGPSNSGKSTFLHSLKKHLEDEYGLAVAYYELDVWSRSLPAFEGKIPFEGRPKVTGLDWDWKTPLDAEIAAFNASTADIVLGDMPGGKKIDEAHDYMVEHARADAAISVSRDTKGLQEWSAYFAGKGLPVAYDVLTFQEGRVPLILVGMDRVIRPSDAGVVGFGRHLLADMARKKK
jgi:energy-coupling factor transporter ATP-binding protein EcfA2